MGEVFGAGGALARRLAGFEARGEQVRMAEAAQRALADGGHLVVEAGTGVGKSFAYLVPAIEAVSRGRGKVLVSTFTITLQEQLVRKDIPFLREALDWGFRAVLAKGRGNYLCRRRLAFALRRGANLFEDKGGQLALIADWAKETADGSLSDLGFLPSAAVWDMVRSEHGNCRGRRCPHFGRCFYWRARRGLETADIVVANHALLFSDLVLKSQGASVLPDYRYVVIDEAHNLEHVAEEHFGIDLSNRRIQFLLDGLYNPRTHKGLLAYGDTERAIELVRSAERENRALFRQAGRWYRENEAKTGGRCYRNFAEQTLTPYLKKLRAELARQVRATEEDDEKFELGRYMDRCGAVVEELEGFLEQREAGHIYWIEASGAGGRTIRLRSAPLNVGPGVRRCLLDVYESVVMTSATLSTTSAEGQEGFEFFAGRIGLEDFEAVKLGSPFDYEEQVDLFIEKDLPSPNSAEFLEPAAEVLKEYLRRTGGSAFVLFTSYSMLQAVAGKLAVWLADNGMELLQQGAGTDRSRLLMRFKSEGRCVLFGTDSFWQGVDVPGDALRNVIIVRLPFGVPDRPLIAGRLERIRQEGGNPFFDYQVPLAILKFKQGFGRLIRGKTDRGIIVVLDSRIVTRRYGRRFLEALPKCRIHIVGR